MGPVVCKRMACNWRLLAALLLVVGLVGVLFVCLLYALTGGDIPFDHGVIIDAGSSHSEVLLYRWQGDKRKGTGQVVQIHECGVTPGISSFPNPYDAGNSLQSCLQEAASLVPEERRARTPVYLGATAGMRLLNVTNPYQSLATFTAVHCAIPKSSMTPKEVGIISGPSEGIFAWTTTNFLLGTLQRREHPTVGAADMGGASTQIAFEVGDPKARSPGIFSMRLYGEDYHVYSVTYLCYGSFEIYRRYLASLVTDPESLVPVENPCGNKGQTLSQDAGFLFDQPCTRTRQLAKWVFLNPEKMNQSYSFEGTGDSDKCRTLVLALFDPEVCSRQHVECFTPIDPLDRPSRFMAFSSYYWTVDFMQAKEKTLQVYRENVRKFCEKTWPDVTSREYPASVEEVVPRYCFQGHMLDVILTTGYGFNETTWGNIQFARKVNGTSVGWALGYMINATNAIPAEAPSAAAISTGLFVVLLVVCVGLLVAGGVFCARARRKSQHATSSQMP